MRVDPGFSAISDRLVELMQSRCPDPALAEPDFPALARELFGLQYSSCPVYRQFCDRRGVSPSRLSNWEQIPAVPTRAWKSLPLTCLAAEERTKVFRSSGTTDQERSQHFHNHASLRVYEAALIAWFQSHVLSPDPRDLTLIALTPAPDAAPDSSLVHMFDTVCRAFPFRESAFVGRAESGGVWRVANAETAKRLRRCIAEQSPVLLVGTAFSYVHWLDWLREGRISLPLPRGSTVMETGGYKGRSRSLPREQLHALIADIFSVSRDHIVTEYGMSELSSQAYDHVAGQPARPTGRSFQFPPWVRVQIISPEKGRPVSDGETGLIQVFDLANVYSVMALQTEDLGRRRGDRFELLGRAAEAEPRGCSLRAA